MVVGFVVKRGLLLAPITVIDAIQLNSIRHANTIGLGKNEHASYVLGDWNEKDCPSGSEAITSKDLCAQAADLWAQAAGEHMSENGITEQQVTFVPQYCTVAQDRTSEKWSVFYNKGAGWYPDGSRRPLCQALPTTTPPPLYARVGPTESCGGLYSAVADDADCKAYADWAGMSLPGGQLSHLSSAISPYGCVWWQGVWSWSSPSVYWNVDTTGSSQSANRQRVCKLQQ